MTRRSTGEKAFAAFNGLMLGAVGLILLIPMLAVLKDSLDLGGQGDITVSFIPKELTLIYYRMVFRDPSVYRPFFNSVFVTLMGTALALVVNTMGAYTMSRRELRGSKFFVYFLVVVPMVIGGGGIVATYIYYKAIRLLNTYAVLFLPTVAAGFWMIIVRQFYWTIPISLTESAELDGASELTIFSRIIAPMSKAVFAALALYTGVAYWNRWLEALLFVHDAAKYTLPLKLRGMLFFGQDSERQMQEWAMTMGIDIEEVLVVFEGLSAAIIVVSVLPVLIIYPYLQRYFAAGVRIGAIKG